MTRAPFTAKGRTILTWQRHRVSLRAPDDLVGKALRHLWTKRASGEEAQGQRIEPGERTLPSRQQVRRSCPRQQAPARTASTKGTTSRPVVASGGEERRQEVKLPAPSKPCCIARCGARPCLPVLSRSAICRRLLVPGSWLGYDSNHLVGAIRVCTR